MIAKPISEVAWRPSFRLIPSRFPPVGLFDRVADPDDLEAVIALEGLTNPRLRQAAGEISLVPPQERISGPGTTPIMAAFTHLAPQGGRFTDGTYGAYYAADREQTAVAEALHHRVRFLSENRIPATEIDMRMYLANIDGVFHDIRQLGEQYPQWYDRDDYASSQALARNLRKEGSDGIVYRSVRHPGGECVAVFRPRCMAPARQGKHFTFVWDGEEITDILLKRHWRPGEQR